MLEFRTAGFNPYSTKYSPFTDNLLAVSAGANFGLVGNGRLYILNILPSGQIVCAQYFETQDCLFDTCWSEAHEAQLLTAGGDGSVKLFDINVPEFPIAQWPEHAREVFCVDWNLVSKDGFLSSSWDGTVKIYSPDRKESLLSLPTHSCVYSAMFSPHASDIVTAVGADSHMRVYDLRMQPSKDNHLALMIPVHGMGKGTRVTGGAENKGMVSVGPSECLTHDWNKYRDNIIATGSVDGVIRTFDIRQPGAGPVVAMAGHEYAVKKVGWSPHLSDVLLSASYDMTCRIWSDGSAITPTGAMTGPNRLGEIGRMDNHTEFTTGLDWCLFGAEGWCATCAWDEKVKIWDIREFMHR